MRKLISLLFMTFSALLCASDKYAYIYPAILENRPNLIEQNLKKWSGNPIKGCKMLHGKGTPFSPEGQTLIVDSVDTSPNYWGQSIKVERGRTYLAGAWVKNDNAKILFWFHANYNNPEKRINERMYFFSGANRFLNSYLSDAIKQRLGENPEQWHLCYRLLTIPTGNTTHLPLNMMIGTYFATGRITIAQPFVIDVTDSSLNTKLMLDFNGEKAVKNISVLEQNTHDIIWQKKFNPPIQSLKTEIPQTNFFRGLDGKLLEGYLLTVEYTDGEISSFPAPQKAVKGL
jgi:hypothetical protein